MSTPKPLVVPPDIFDTLALSALANGGIGRGQCYDYDRPDCRNHPHCLRGHRSFCGIPEGENPTNGATFLFSTLDNDTALYDAGVAENEKVSWTRYCTLRNIIRGDA